MDGARSHRSVQIGIWACNLALSSVLSVTEDKSIWMTAVRG